MSACRKGEHMSAKKGADSWTWRRGTTTTALMPDTFTVEGVPLVRSSLSLRAEADAGFKRWKRLRFKVRKGGRKVWRWRKVEGATLDGGA
eukprot:scaffold145405_cov33-Tisochrysis_lutea.AAC.1